MHIPRPWSRCCFSVKKRSGSETGKGLCLAKNIPGFGWWLLILATPHSGEAGRGLRISGFRAVLTLKHPAVVSWCNTFRGGDWCAAVPMASAWDAQSLQNLDLQPQLVHKSWLEMGAEAPGPGRCFPFKRLLPTGGSPSFSKYFSFSVSLKYFQCFTLASSRK